MWSREDKEWSTKGQFQHKHWWSKIASPSSSNRWLLVASNRVSLDSSSGSLCGQRSRDRLDFASKFKLSTTTCSSRIRLAQDHRIRQFSKIEPFRKLLQHAWSKEPNSERITRWGSSSSAQKLRITPKLVVKANSIRPKWPKFTWIYQNENQRKGSQTQRPKGRLGKSSRKRTSHQETR